MAVSVVFLPRGATVDLQCVILAFPGKLTSYLLFVFLLSCDYDCSVALPRGTMSWLWHFLVILTCF